MDWNDRKFTAIFVRTCAPTAAFVLLGVVLAGCSGGPQIDKYTVTDADRQAAKASLGPDGKPLPGSSANIPRDPADGAAYGPDGKRIGVGGGP